MSVFNGRIILRKGTEEDFNNSPADSYEVGELIFLDDVGKLVIKKADGQLVCVDPNELKNYLSKKEGNALIAELKDNIENSQFIDDFEYNSETGELKFFSGNDQVGDTVTLAISSDQQGLAFNGGFVDEENKLHFTQDGEDVEGFDPILLPATGGGGAGGSRLTFSLTSGKLISVADESTECNITFNFNSVDIETKDDTGDGTLQISVGGILKSTTTINQGANVVNVMDFIQLGENSVSLTITDGYGATATRTCTIHRESLNLAWNLGTTEVNSGTLSIQLTPTGTGNKTIVVLVDDEVYSSDVVSYNRKFTKDISTLEPGAHIIKAYCTLNIGSTILQSNTLICAVAQITSGNTLPIVAAVCQYDSVEQFTSLSIPFRVVDNNNNPALVQLSVNGSVIETRSVDQTEQLWTYRPTTVGQLTLEISCGSARWIRQLSVNGLAVPVEEISDNLVYKLDPSAMTTLDGIALSDNFDVINGGLVTDDEGVRCFRVMKGDRAILPIHPFATDSKRDGKALKFIYKVENCSKFDSSAIESFNSNIGFKINANSLMLKSEQQTLTMQTCEGIKSEIDFVIQSNSNGRMTIYEDSIPAQTIQYASADNFVQSSPQSIVIGSDDCTVSIYLIRYYRSELVDNEVLTNYIYDGKDSTEIQTRYNRSLIYDGVGNISPERCAELCPNARVLIWQAPNISISKKNEVIGNLRQIYKAGGIGHNWTAYNVIDKVQGTSSARYVNAGLNQDFNCKEGFTLEDGSVISDYAMTKDSIPVHYFNNKVNIASSENINNIILALWYNKYQPYLRPARIADSHVRDTVEGHMSILFFQNTGEQAVQIGAINVDPGQTILYGLGCMNNSKKNYNVFGHNDTDDVAVIEVNNNTSDNNLFKSDDLSAETWDDNGSYQWRYLSSAVDEDEIKAKWQQLLSFVVSCNPDTATGNLLDTPVEYSKITYKYDSSEYRKAKFYAEIGNYVSIDSVLYHYLFTLVFSMVDNRAKNTFWGYSMSTGKWHLCYGYDFDTAMGNDNEGALALRYGYLDTDTKGSRDVFNAADSVLFVLIRETFSQELEDMYTKLEDNGCWDLDRFANLCDEYQDKICPALWIEDAYRKYLSPLEMGDSSYLQMLNGKKKLQRRQFLKFQRQFISSYFKGSYTQSDIATLRGYTPSDWQGVEPKCAFTIVPYCDMFINIDAGSESKSVRAYAGQPVSLDFTAIGKLNNTEIYFYNAQYLQDIGDISCIYPGYCSLAALKRLKKAIIGSSVTGYQNTNLRIVDLSNCESLEELNIENCSSFSSTLELSNNVMLKKLYTRGSNVTGITLAHGCRLVEAYLNAVTALRLRGMNYLKTLNISDYGNLTTLVVENSPAIDIAQLCNSSANLAYISLKGISLKLENSSLLMRLSKLKGVDDNGYISDKPIVTGTAELQGMSDYCRNIIETTFSNLNLQVYSVLASYSVKFVLDDEGTQYGETQIIEEGSNATKPTINPTRDKTASTVYDFVGWVGDYTNIREDTVLTASWLTSTRRYVVNWVNLNGSIVQTKNLGYGDTVSYDGEDLVGDSENLWVGWDWKDWTVAAESITPETEELKINASYESIVLPPVRNLEEYDYIHSDDYTDKSAYTLGELAAIVNSHLAEEYGFEVNDLVKIVPVPNTKIPDEYIIFRVERFNDRRLENGGEKDATHENGDYSDFANISFGMVGTLANDRAMNSTNTNEGGFANTTMRTYLNDTVFSVLPPGWRSIIKPVQVYTTIGNSKTEMTCSICKLRLYNAVEVGWSTSEPYVSELDSARQDDGADKMPYYRSNSNKKRKYNGTGDYTSYWTNSPAAGSASAFCYVSDNGASLSSNATYGYSVACCFSI